VINEVIGAMINLSQAQTLLENKRRMFGTTEWKVFERGCLPILFWLGNKIKSNKGSASQISFTPQDRSPLFLPHSLS
jgi:hypothetical protein